MTVRRGAAGHESPAEGAQAGRRHSKIRYSTVPEFGSVQTEWEDLLQERGRSCS